MNSIPPRTPGDMNLANQGFIQISPGVWERPKAGKVVAQPEIIHKPVDRERDLHDEIIAYCKKMGWICLYSRMDMATTRICGEFDFCCILPKGIVLFLECKTKTGKLSPAQSALEAWMVKLDHKIYVIRSLGQFIDLCGLAMSGNQCVVSKSF